MARLKDPPNLDILSIANNLINSKTICEVMVSSIDVYY